MKQPTRYLAKTLVLDSLAYKLNILATLDSEYTNSLRLTLTSLTLRYAAYRLSIIATYAGGINAYTPREYTRLVINKFDSLKLLHLHYNLNFSHHSIVYNISIYYPLEDFFDGSALDCITSYRSLLNAKYYAY